MPFDGERAKKRDPKEISVEDSVVGYARRRGYFSAKVQFPGHRGAADRIFIRESDVFFIEFKRPRRAVTRKNQTRFRRIMKEQDIDVFFANTVVLGKEVIDSRD